MQRFRFRSRNNVCIVLFYHGPCTAVLYKVHNELVVCC